ncbi:MAG: hypothetical protein EB036_05640, partial [Betaproteobacteria bacterium]|nr:hypothetical protein [Betaproteobacteria bacterium]
LRKSRRSNQKATIRSLFVFAFFVLKGRFILPFFMLQWFMLAHHAALSWQPPLSRDVLPC